VFNTIGLLFHPLAVINNTLVFSSECRNLCKNPQADKEVASGTITTPCTTVSPLQATPPATLSYGNLFIRVEPIVTF